MNATNSRKKYSSKTFSEFISVYTVTYPLPLPLPLPFVLYPLPFALCPLSFALCPLPFVLCPLPFVLHLCPLPSVPCRQIPLIEMRIRISDYRKVPTKADLNRHLKDRNPG